MVRSKVGSLPMHTCVRVCTHRCTHARNVMAHIVCDRRGGGGGAVVCFLKHVQLSLPPSRQSPGSPLICMYACIYLWISYPKMHKHHGTRHRIRCGRRDLNGSLNRERVFNRVHNIFPYVMRRLTWIIFASRKLENVVPSRERIVRDKDVILKYYFDRNPRGPKASKR